MNMSPQKCLVRKYFNKLANRIGPVPFFTDDTQVLQHRTSMSRVKARIRNILSETRGEFKESRFYIATR